MSTTPTAPPAAPSPAEAFAFAVRSIGRREEARKQQRPEPQIDQQACDDWIANSHRSDPFADPAWDCPE